MVFKIFTRIIIILLAAGLVSGGLYLAFDHNTQIGLAAGGFGNRGGARNFGGNGAGLPNLLAALPQDFGRSGRGGGTFSNFPLFSFLQMIALVAAMSLGVALVEKLGRWIARRLAPKRGPARE